MSVNDSFLPGGRLANVTQAASESFEWGLSLARALSHRGAWESGMWKALCRAWLKVVSTDEQRSSVLTLLLGHPKLDIVADEVAELLVHWWWTDKVADPSPALLSEAEEIAERIWTAAKSQPPLSNEPINGWLHEAINHPAGKVTQFWLYSLSLFKKRLGEKWPGQIPDVYLQRLAAVVSGADRAAQLGRVVVGSQVRFLFAVDRDWTRENILPLLDFTLSVDRARSVWDGFLSWGMWDENIPPDLLLLYERGLPYLLGTNHKRDRLCEHLASIAVFGSINPLQDGWLGKFVVQADDETIATWSVYLRQNLESLSDEKIAALWDRWLALYWDRRNYGDPRPAGETEIRTIVEWLPSLRVVFTQAVARAVALSAPEFQYTNLYARLLKRNIQESNPVQLLELLLHLMPAIPPGSTLFNSDIEKLLSGIPSASVSSEVYRRVCDELSRIGSPNAAEILAEFLTRSEETAATQDKVAKSDIFSLIASLQPGNRNKADINDQVRQERESWERDN